MDTEIKIKEHYANSPAIIPKVYRGAFNNIVKTSRKKRGVPEMLSQFHKAYGKRKFVNKRYHGYLIGNCIYIEGEDPTCLMICDDAKIREVKEKDIVWLL